MYVFTPDKNDTDISLVGNLITFNAMKQEEDIEFAENYASAQDRFHDTMRLHNFNILDISGKFGVQNRYNDDIDEMKEALDYWGYPVHDTQTPWINS